MVLNYILVGCPCLSSLLSFSNDDGEGNENAKKAIGLLSKTTTLHVNHTFLYISLLSLHDYDVKYLISRFTGDVNKRRRIFLSLSKLECGPQEINSREIRLHLSFSADWNKRDNVWKTRMPFKLTFSLPSPSSLLKLPNSYLFRTSSIPLHWFC